MKRPELSADFFVNASGQLIYIYKNMVYHITGIKDTFLGITEFFLKVIK